jgi:hypothetical protein
MPALDAELAKTVELCLCKEREQRFASALELGAKLASIARRLADDPKALGQSPRRRATDNLPPPPSRAEVKRDEKRAVAALPFGVRVFRGLSSLRPPRSVVATAATLVGAAIGILLSQWWQQDAQRSVNQLSATERSSSVQAAASDAVLSDAQGSRLASNPQPQYQKQPTVEERLRSSTREIKLGQAIARGIKGKEK